MEPLDGASTIEQALMARAMQHQIPINGSLELSPLCNMDCRMCYVRLSRSQLEAWGRLRTAEEWLSVGKQMQQAGTLFLLLTGGEPLLYPDFMEVYLGLKRLGMVLTVNTNGTLIDEEWAAFFGKYKPRRINITLYGADNRAYKDMCHYPGGFDRVVKAVRLLRSQGVDVKLSGSITPANEADVAQLLDIGDALGVPMRMDTYMMPALRERPGSFDMESRLAPEQAASARIRALRGEMGQELFCQYRQQTLDAIDSAAPCLEEPGAPSCYAGSCSFTVNWQGLLRPCVVLTDPAADVFRLGFQEAWKLVSTQFRQIRLSPKCSACTLRPLCRTCAACALLETGSYDGTPDYMCRYTRESLRLLQESLT